MARPKSGYGPGIVGVTTAINMFGGNKGALMYWAWDQGRQGLDFRETRDKAADAGTLAHEMIEAELRGLPLPDTSQLDKEVVNQAETAYLSFLDWAKLVQYTIIETEISLVDPDLKVGGTMDKVSIQGKLCITDFKTSKGGTAYLEHWLQLAAYGHLWTLHHPEQPPHDYYVLILDKQTGGFSYHHKVKMDKHLEMFKHLVAVYHLYKEIK